MKIQDFNRPFATLLSIGLMWLIGTGTALGQFTQNRDTIRVDTSAYPLEVRTAFGIFRVKCGECHDLDKSLKPNMSPAQWMSVIKQMQAMASSHINDGDANKVLDFLSYYESHRKSEAKPATQTADSDPIAAGRQFYSAKSCDTCHSINGKGGSIGPSLTDVGARLSRDQLMHVVQGMGKAGSSMPPLPPETTDKQVSSLVDFLTTLK